MEEAQRLLTVSVWKLYRCRLQRGGLRLHRSLQLSLLVRAARHRYLSARAAAQPGPGTGTPLGGAPVPHRGQPPTGDPRCAQERGDTPSRPVPDRGTPPSRPVWDPRSIADRWDPPDHMDPTNRDHPPATPIRDHDPPPLPPRDPRSAARAPPPPEPGSPGPPRAGRKRRSSGCTGAGPVPVPSKRARLEAEEPPLPPGPPGRCSGPPAAAFGLLVRAVGAC
ncbi:immediate early response gene 2 protein isoform X3 [Falco rusticolus]|uniref:immediate early response gene 2 protein isoform X3 n=1 Tax=Falco rusticolus TaxID=120794 RepID=UPI0018866CBC|nr:immediate early response gene 2 protein isoform X3 [Falco rusticolus]